MKVFQGGFPRSGGSVSINFGSELAGFGRNRDFIGPYFNESARHREIRRLLVLNDFYFARYQQRQQRTMIGKDAELAFGPRKNAELHFTAEDLAFGRNYFQEKCFCG